MFCGEIRYEETMSALKAYTGLSYADSQIFNFMNMTEKQNEFYYVDGKRIKTRWCKDNKSVAHRQQFPKNKLFLRNTYNVFDALIRGFIRIIGIFASFS